jgi:hypothetical protein
VRPSRMTAGSPVATRAYLRRIVCDTSLLVTGLVLTTWQFLASRH